MDPGTGKKHGKKHPFGVRPISQTGLLLIPKSPLQRRIIAGAPERRFRLDRLNEIHAKRGWVLHPTKGWRKISVRRSKADRINQAVKRGRVQLSLKKIRKWLIGGG